MICKRCGKDVLGSSKCLYCGKMMNENSSSLSQHPTDEPTSSNSTNTEASDTVTSYTDSSSTSYENTYTSSEDVVKEWKGESVAAKVEIGFSILFSIIWFAFAGLILYSSLASNFDWKPLIDFSELFAEKNDTEILYWFENDGMKYVTLFFAVIISFGFLTTLFGTISFFDLAKWLDNKKIDCRPLLQGSSDIKTQPFNFLLGSSLLIKEKPRTKNIYYFRLIATLVLGVLVVITTRQFFSELIVGIYEGVEVYNLAFEEVLKNVFLSPKAIIFYVVLVTELICNITIKKMLQKRQKENIEYNANAM